MPGGAPITVSRTYDSQYASQNTGLGYGWRLDATNPSVKTTAQSQFRDEQTKSLSYGDLVYISLPGGGQQVFAFTPVPDMAWSPVGGIVQDLVPYLVKFTAVDGNNSVLTVVDPLDPTEGGGTTF